MALYGHLLCQVPYIWDKLVGQTGTAFRSAAGQYFAAISVSHSLPETVLLLSVELLGLVRSQHSHLPPFEDNLAS